MSENINEKNTDEIEKSKKTLELFQKLLQSLIDRKQNILTKVQEEGFCFAFTDFKSAGYKIFLGFVPVYSEGTVIGKQIEMKFYREDQNIGFLIELFSRLLSEEPQYTKIAELFNLDRLIESFNYKEMFNSIALKYYPSRLRKTLEDGRAIYSTDIPVYLYVPEVIEN